MFAFFREAIQNSIDALSKNIKINYFYKNTEKQDLLTIQFSDDGIGMSLDTLLNVLLKMGGTKKVGDNNIGGFGYAKSILFFAHNSYSIKTGNYIVEGVGGEYTYRKATKFIKGTSFEITLNNDFYYTIESTIKQYIDQLLSFSTFSDVNFIINKKKIKVKSKKFKYHLSSELGNISFEDNGIGTYSTLWVRVNGLTMFEHAVSQSKQGTVFQGVLDLNDSPLVMLTANRDGLQYQYNSILNTIFSQLSTEREKLTYNGMFNFILNESKDPNINVIDPTELEPNFQQLIEESLLSNNFSNNSYDFSKEKTINPTLLNKVFTDLSSEQDKFDDFFKNAITKINQKYYPYNFCISTKKQEQRNITIYKKFFKELMKNKNIKIATSFNIIVDNILNTPFFKEFITIKNNKILFDNNIVRKGFVFGDDDLLGCNDYSNKVYCISINPVNTYVNTTYDCILDIAIHECCHLLIQGHDSSFAFSEFLIRRSIQENINHNKLKNEIKTAYLKLFNEKEL